MTKLKQKKSFMAKHKKGLIGAGIFIFIWIIISSIYATFRASFEASLAVNQVNDSVMEYSLIQKIIYGDLLPWFISIIFFIFVVLCLFPTIKDLVRRNN